MEGCSAKHECWTIGPLHRQKLTLATKLWLQSNSLGAPWSSFASSRNKCTPNALLLFLESSVRFQCKDNE